MWYLFNPTRILQVNVLGRQRAIMIWQDDGHVRKDVVGAFKTV